MQNDSLARYTVHIQVWRCLGKSREKAHSLQITYLLKTCMPIYAKPIAVLKAHIHGRRCLHAIFNSFARSMHAQ